MVLLTLGYGDVVPLSPAAKLITILYAAIGLPIFLNAISSTQDTLNEIVDRWLIVYAKIRDNKTFANAKLLTTASLWVLYLHMGKFVIVPNSTSGICFRFVTNIEHVLQEA